MAYLMYSLSSILLMIGLATLLHLQFGVTGIVNFGIVGFWGIGLYGMGVFLTTLHIPYILALLMAVALTGVIALGLGAIILKMDGQAVLVATLAFATIMKNLAVTEKWLTKGVKGMGTVPFPFQIGRYSDILFFAILLIIVGILIIYTYKLEAAPYGRLLASIQDNETLARGLGKSTFRHKLIFFTLTSAIVGMFGVLSASLDHFLVPRMLDPGLTFTVWIALILGGRKRVLGGLVGAIITLGIFDLLIETYAPIPSAYAQVVPAIKYSLYGLTLLLILMFRPEGLLGAKKKNITGNLIGRVGRN